MQFPRSPFSSAESPFSPAALSQGGFQICALASIGVINVAIWVLLCILVKLWTLGLAFTAAYGVVLMAFIRRLERDPRNRNLVEFLYAGLPVLLFVLGLYAVRCLNLAFGSSGPRATLLMLAACATCPSLGLSGQLLKRRRSGPLVVNVMFGLWLFVFNLRMAALPLYTAVPGNGLGELLRQARDIADFGADFLFLEGLLGFLASIRLHNAELFPSATLAWLQGVSAVAMLVPAHYILRLPAWESGSRDAGRWLGYGVLCLALLTGAASTGRLAAGVCGSTGLGLLMLRLALACTDLARGVVGLRWDTDYVPLICVFSLSLSLLGFGTLHVASSRNRLVA